MRVRPISEKSNDGKMILMYSETGAGKSTSAAQSLPTPIMYMCAEARNAELSFDASGRNIVLGDMSNDLGNINDYVIVEYQDWYSMLDFLDDTVSNCDKLPFKSYVLDGITQLTVNLAEEISTAGYKASKVGQKGEELQKIIERKIIQEQKMSIEGFGALAAQMNRAIRLLGKLTQAGKYVIINALLEERPKWNVSLSAAPSLMGKKFGNDLPGACDLIGMTVRRYEEDEHGNIIKNRIVFPPFAMFECEESEHFECKWTGPRIRIRDRSGNDIPNALMRFPLDYRIILGTRE